MRAAIVHRRGVQHREAGRNDRTAPPLPLLSGRGLHMLMFNRSQLYIGLALAALVQIFVVAHYVIR